MIDKFSSAGEYFCTTMCSKVLCRSYSKVVYVPLIHIYKGIDSISEIQFISWICELNDIVVTVSRKVVKSENSRYMYFVYFIGLRSLCWITLILLLL
jgi:hypothetical protein